MRFIIRRRSKFPKYVRHFVELKGICVGECINKSLLISTNEEPAIGHAHSDHLDPYRGWICLEHKYLLKEKYTLLHEVAHLIANKFSWIPDHGKEWRKVVVKIGGTFKPYLTHDKKRVYDDFSHSDPVRKVR